MKLVWSANALDEQWIKLGVMPIRMAEQISVRAKMSVTTRCSVKGGATSMASA